MKEVLKELWECWKVCHNTMIEKAERGDDSGRVLGGWCDEIKEMILYVIENEMMDVDTEVDEIVNIVEMMRYD